MTPSDKQNKRYSYFVRSGSNNNNNTMYFGFSELYGYCMTSGETDTNIINYINILYIIKIFLMMLEDLHLNKQKPPSGSSKVGSRAPTFLKRE